jgi:hypothetical protein
MQLSNKIDGRKSGEGKAIMRELVFDCETKENSSFLGESSDILACY